MSDSRTEVDAIREIQRLENLMRNCLHGGPSQDEQGMPWFQEANALVAWEPTALDIFMALGRRGGDDAMKTALIATINFIANRQGGFPLCLSNIGSTKYLASLAVDAWINEDYVYVRKFLIKSIILNHLQHAGVDRSIRELHDENVSGERNSLFQRIKGVASCPDPGLKSILGFSVGNSCLCIELSQAINDEKESLLNPNNNDSKARKQREEDRLPPVLQSSSKYWIIKKRAVDCLKKKNTNDAIKLYLEARAMLEQHRDLRAPKHEYEHINMIGDEMGKLSSNLSMIYLMSGSKQKALECAKESVASCPGWSKSHCRLALALKALGRLKEARVAIFNAIKICQREALTKDTEKQLGEYQNIQNEIQTELDTHNNHETEVNDNPFYRPITCDLRTNQVGIVPGNQDISDIIYSFLSPVDVAKLECTCKRFAIPSEHVRRIALVSKLVPRREASRDAYGAVVIEKSFVRYVNALEENNTMALIQFITEVRPLIDDVAFINYILSIKMVPLLLKTVLVSAFSNSIDDVEEILLDSVVAGDFASSRDFEIAKFLLQSACSRSVKNGLLVQMTFLNDDDEEDGKFLRGFIYHSVDISVMNLVVNVGDGIDDQNLKEAALILLNNTILSKCRAKRQRMTNIQDPITRHITSFFSLYTENILHDWPGVDDKLLSWNRIGSVTKESIEHYWNNETPVFQMWNDTLFTLLQWVREVEKSGYEFEVLHVSRTLLADLTDGVGSSPLNYLSFGPFLVMKVIESGGTVSLSVKLKTQQDFTEFFLEYYDFVRLFGAGFSALDRFHDSVLAEHHALMG